jgi:hypothetical protein
MTHKVIQHIRFKCKTVVNEKVDSPPFILSKTTIQKHVIKIKITFKPWTKLMPLRLSHMLNFEESGMMSNKSWEVFVPRDLYVQNMIMDQYVYQNYDEQISDKKKNRLHIKMGIESEPIYSTVAVPKDKQEKPLSPRQAKL